MAHARVAISTAHYSRISDNSRETLRETIANGTASLVHTWRFDLVPAGSSHLLHVEGKRPSNTDGDDFEFSQSVDGVNFTPIPGAVINSTSDVSSNPDYAIPVGTGGTWYIRIRDTKSASGESNLDTVDIDHLIIRTVP